MIRRAGEAGLDLHEGCGYPCCWTVAAVFRLADRHVRCPDYDLLYPINALRNVALEAVRSELVFLLDVDFVPSWGLYFHI
eukprot:10843342-Alexandrium_andersonii.AAC.1